MHPTRRLRGQLRHLEDPPRRRGFDIGHQPPGGRTIPDVVSGRWSTCVRGPSHCGYPEPYRTRFFQRGCGHQPDAGTRQGLRAQLVARRQSHRLRPLRAQRRSRDDERRRQRSASAPKSAGIGSPAWQPAQVSMTAGRHVTNAGTRVGLVVRIVASGTVNPTVTIQRRTVSTGWAAWRVVEVDGGGIASVAAGSIREHTWFRAVWTGDTSHLGARSITVLVRARAAVVGHLFRNYGHSGAWRMYHSGRPVWYASALVPRDGGDNGCALCCSAT